MTRNTYKLVLAFFVFAIFSCSYVNNLKPVKSYRAGFLPNEVAQLLKPVKIITVCQKGKGGYSSIQAAIDSIEDSSNNMDEVRAHFLREYLKEVI